MDKHRSTRNSVLWRRGRNYQNMYEPVEYRRSTSTADDAPVYYRGGAPTADDHAPVYCRRGPPTADDDAPVYCKRGTYTASEKIKLGARDRLVEKLLAQYSHFSSPSPHPPASLPPPPPHPPSSGPLPPPAPGSRVENVFSSVTTSCIGNQVLYRIQ